MSLITGILRGPYGDPQPGVIITMRAKGTSSKVLISNSSATTTDNDGKYSMQVFPGRYEVMVSTIGKIGEIQVFSDSKDGTLNDFLLTPGEEELSPEIVQTVDTMRADAAKSAAAAKVSEKNAEATLASAVKKGDYGVGGSSKGFMASASSDLMKACKERGGGFVRNNTGTAGVPTYGAGVYARSEDTNTLIVASYLDANLFVLACSDNSINDVKINRIWGSVNTTVDSNGFIKKASPIVKLFRDGTCELNDESQGVTTERVSDGVYRVSGTLGFNADAEWGGPDGGIEVPLDRNKQPLIWVDYEVEATGDLLIKTFHRTHPTAPAFARNEVMGYDEGMPIDIPKGRWVDLRVEMPAAEESDPDIEVEEAEPEN